MSKIKILPEILSNKIAAGEVVERPASVVKELVENAIDAGSDRITIEIAQGGRSLIRVSDNGTGMGHDDALLAIERYATSKIASETDLYAIRTLGFRGEALPSIAAVSRFSLVSKDDVASAATEIQVDGGKIVSVKETGAPRGTMITVRQLFYNTPARRKFLKTVNTEMGHIADLVACFALARPDIRFHLIHNDRTLRDWTPTTEPVERIADVLGGDLKRSLYPIQKKTGDAAVTGWIADPGITRNTAQKIFIFVNGRHIRDRGIVYALIDGYAGRIMKGKFPLAVVCIEMAPDSVDVNVHPTKHEVRFARRQAVFDAVRSAVAEAWQTARSRSGPAASTGSTDVSSSFENNFHAASPAKAPKVREPSERFGPKRNAFSPSSPPAKKAESADLFSNPPELSVRSEEQAPYSRGTETTAPQQAPIWAQAGLQQATVIGQFHNTYILCEIASELVLVDQHAAHERILYERLRSSRKAGSVPVQRLLVPETIELRYRECAVIEQMLPDLKALGLEIEPFGGNTVVVKAVPDVLADVEIRPLIVEIAETADAIGYSPGLDAIIDKCTILMACHGAIRAHQSLTTKEMQAILAQLDRCENPFNCPHGRPTTIRWHLKSLEKQFKRTL